MRECVFVCDGTPLCVAIISAVTITIAVSRRLGATQHAHQCENVVGGKGNGAKGLGRGRNREGGKGREHC